MWPRDAVRHTGRCSVDNWRFPETAHVPRSGDRRVQRNRQRGCSWFTAHDWWVDSSWQCQIDIAEPYRDELVVANDGKAGCERLEQECTIQRPSKQQQFVRHEQQAAAGSNSRPVHSTGVRWSCGRTRKDGSPFAVQCLLAYRAETQRALASAQTADNNTWQDQRSRSLLITYTKLLEYEY